MNWWDTKTLQEMTRKEWESLCDGCAKCCQIQLQDEQGQRATTSVVCKYMDIKSCRCTVYSKRTRLVSNCLKLTPGNLDDIEWMPDTCAYRLLRDGMPLPEWHPLLTGDPESAHTSGNSVMDRVVSEAIVDENDLEEFIIQWH